MQIIDGKKIRDNILRELKNEIESIPFTPMFCDILVGGDPVSFSYVKIKSKYAESIGIKFREVLFDKESTTETIINEIKNLNNVPYMCGIIIQLPLPSNIDKDKVLDAINTNLDVDCLSKENSDNFYEGKPKYIFPTALAILYILDSLKIDKIDKSILVLGQGKLVGAPVSYLLKNRGYNVKTINSKTENINDLIKNADIIISAIGKGGFIKGDMVKDGVVIIDAGTSEDNGSIVGDIDINSFENKDAIITPCPGGVGPVTVAMLLRNVLESSKFKIFN